MWRKLNLYQFLWQVNMIRSRVALRVMLWFYTMAFEGRNGSWPFLVLEIYLFTGGFDFTWNSAFWQSKGRQILTSFFRCIWGFDFWGGLSVFAGRDDDCSRLQGSRWEVSLSGVFRTSKAVAVWWVAVKMVQLGFSALIKGCLLYTSWLWNNWNALS